MGDPHQIEIRLDGALLKRFSVGGEGKGRASAESFIGQNQGDPEWEVYMQTADAGLEVRLPVKAGTREVAISFVRQYYEPTGILQPPQHGFAPHATERSTASVRRPCFIGGPHSIAGPGHAEPRRLVLSSEGSLRRDRPSISCQPSRGDYVAFTEKDLSRC